MGNGRCNIIQQANFGKGQAGIVELGRRDTGWTMRISAAAPVTGTKNAVESFNVSMRVQKALH